MSLCINPRCLEPDHPGNDSNRFCQSCGSDLVLQQRYRVLRLLSDSSGFGKVYEAYERTSPKILKVLKENFSSNAKAVELFQQEAQVLSRLHHPGIPLIEPNGYFQYVPRDGKTVLHCIIMEKIDGPNLREWMKQQGNHPISEQQALDWLKQIALILHLIHQQNYFHRDIKPENIMLRSSGQLTLVDFGAAREMTLTYLDHLSGGSSGVTRISSAGYTPPEQEHGQAVPQSDFYALGRTFIYLLTAKLPTDTEIYDPMQNEFHWRNFALHVSPQLANFIDRLIASKVSDRPKNTQEILDTLEHLIGESSSLPPSHTPYFSTHTNGLTAINHATQPQLGTRLLLEPKRIWLIGAIAALVAASGGYAVWQGQQQAIVTSAFTAMVEPLATIDDNMGSINDMVTSPGDNAFVTASADNTVRIWDIQTGSLLRTLKGHTSFVNAVAVSPDGQYLVSGGADKQVLIWSIQTGQLLKTLKGHNSFINAILISHDGNLIFSADAGGAIKVWDLQTGAERATLGSNSAAVNTLIMSRDSQMLFSGEANGAIDVWNVAPGATFGQMLKTIPAHDGAVNSLLVSQDGERLISAGADSLVKIWTIKTGEAAMTFSGHASPVNALQLSADGRMLYSASADKTIKQWNLATGELVRTLEGFETHIDRFAITPDQRVVTTGKGLRVLHIWQMPPS